jgi:hypothetical protein
MSPFGNSEVARILWEELQILQPKHRQYVTLVYQDFCKVCNELYKNKIFQREELIHLYYKVCIEKCDRYLSNSSYTFFCNALQAHLKVLKRIYK